MLRQEDPLVQSLKNKFFSLIKQEKYPQTPEISEELDFLSETIRELEKENQNDDN